MKLVLVLQIANSVVKDIHWKAHHVFFHQPHLRLHVHFIYIIHDISNIIGLLGAIFGSVSGVSVIVSLVYFFRSRYFKLFLQYQHFLNPCANFNRRRRLRLKRTKVAPTSPASSPPDTGVPRLEVTNIE